MGIWGPDDTQQAKSVLAPKTQPKRALGVSRVSWAAPGTPLGIYTMRASRLGHDDDVNLARGSQYSTRPASASHTFSTKLQSGQKEKMNGPPYSTYRILYIRIRRVLLIPTQLFPQCLPVRSSIQGKAQMGWSLIRLIDHACIGLSSLSAHGWRWSTPRTPCWTIWPVKGGW